MNSQNEKRGFFGKIASKVSRFNSVNCSAIIVAGGKGTRFSQTGTKQMETVKGIPVVVRSVNAFESSDIINEIIIVVRDEEKEVYEQFREQYGWKKVTRITSGGEERCDSVLCGFKCISDKSQYVFIHDAARCLITPDMILAVGRDALKYGAACAAEKARDSVKSAEKDLITENLDRSKLWYAQTPQAFKTELYRAAVYTAVGNGSFHATDDCTLVGNIGYAVHLTDCGSENMKITYPADIRIAEAILDYRESQNGENNE